MLPGIWNSRMRQVSGVSIKDAKLADFQRLVKCTDMHQTHCGPYKKKGQLHFPEKCSSPPCSDCPGAVFNS